MEKFFSMGASFFVSIYVIRYLGPENVGVMDFALTLTHLFIPILGMGLGGILVKGLVKNEESSSDLLSAAFFLKLIIGSILYLALFLYLTVFENNADEKLYILVFGLAYFLNSFTVLEHYFVSKVQAKKNAIARMISITAVSIIKLILVELESDLIFFVLTTIIETAIYSGMLVIAYVRTRPSFSRPKTSKILFLIKGGWPFILSDYSMFFLKKVDLLLIKYFLGFIAVGYYSVAVKLSEFLAIVPMVVLTSIFPLLVKSDGTGNLDNSMRTLYRYFLPGMIIICLGVTTFSEEIIILLFGKEFIQSSFIFTIYAWSSVFMTMHMINNKWFVIRGLQKEFFYRALFAGILNIMLSFVAIKEMGLIGGAIGTFVSMFVLAYFSLYFSKSGKELLFIIHRSFKL